MRIVHADLGLLRAPLRTPFRTALRQVDAVEDIVLRLHADDGRIGYGSAAPTAAITGDTHGAIVAALRDHILPRLIGTDIADLGARLHAVETAIQRNTSARAAAEIALYDLWAQSLGAPLYRVLGGGEPQLLTDLTVSLDAADRMAQAAQDAVQRGFTALKVKLGREPARDIERVHAIHAVVAGRALLRLDANQGWTAKQAVRVMRTLERDGVPIDLLEQPVPAHDLDGLRHVTRHIETAVMADEAVFGPRDALTLMRRGAADILNIKLMKSAGLSQALRIAELAAAQGIECMMGCMIESGIGIAAAAHLAVARARIITRVDLDVPALCAFDPVDCDVRHDGPRITIGDGAGLGIRALHGWEPLPDA